MTTREQAIATAGAAAAEAELLMRTLPIVEAARRAYNPARPELTVEVLAERIRAHRAQTPVPSTTQDATTAPDTSRRTA